MNTIAEFLKFNSSFPQRSGIPFFLYLGLFLFVSSVFAQTATEDFSPTADVFGGGVSGTNWVNNSWIRSGGNGNTGDVQAINPTDGDDNIGGDLLQLDDNDAGAYRTIDLSTASSATLSFVYDYDNAMDGGETLLIQIDPENDGTYITLQTITATTNSPNPEVNVNIAIPLANLGGANTRIRFITGANNGINRNGEDWWIDNISLVATGSTDSDGDGIVDAIDLDDDNDGIPDLNESENLIQVATFDEIVQPTSGNNLGVSIAPWILTSGGTNIVRVNGDTSYGNSGPRLDANPATTTGVEQHYFDINGNGDLYQPFTIVTSRTITYSGFFSPRDGNSGTASISIREGTGNTGPLMDTTGTVTITSNGGDSQNAPWTFAESTVLLPPGTYSVVIVMSNATNFDEGKVQAADLDTDGDGIINILDLDSDNDGIYDAVEAGHGQSHTNGVLTGAVGTDGIPDSVQSTANSNLINYSISDSDSDSFFDFLEIDADDDTCNDVVEAGYTDVNNDGILGALPTLVDTDGLVIGTSVVDGYTVPEDGDSNLVFDFQEAGALPSITIQPVNQTVFFGQDGTFTVAATGTAIAYQWQRSINGGSTYANIVDGVEYSGTTTNSLTALAIPLIKNNYLYRAIVTSTSYQCGSVISNAALLNTRVRTVITNRRITKRVNRN